MKHDETPIQVFRERLTETLAEWGTEMSTVLQELDRKREALAELQSKDTEIQRLSADNEAKDAELHRLGSELESKQELIGALRRETRARIDTLETEVRSLREDEQGEAQGESAELAAVRAELDARKTLIKSLRADADRVDALEASLEEKREIIATLEASINRHAETIAELKRASDMWKGKYQDLKGTATTTIAAGLAPYVDTGFEALEGENGSMNGSSERTIAIDMRQSLLEARRRAAPSRGNES